MLGQKRLEILREIAPKASLVAMLANPISPDAVPEIGTVQAAAQSMGVELAMFNVSAASANTAGRKYRASRSAWRSDGASGARSV